MSLFMSKGEREAREKVAIQMGRKAIRDYVGNCRTNGDRYLAMAKKALSLGQRQQAEHYVATQMQYQNQCNRWESFLLKLDDIVMRGAAMGAMSGLMEGMSQMCQNISRGISVRDIQKTMVHLQESMIKVDQAEAQLGSMMDGLSLQVGPEAFEASYQELSPELKQEVSSICDHLLDEVRIEETYSPSRARDKHSLHPREQEQELQGRINQQLERLKKLRQRK